MIWRRLFGKQKKDQKHIVIRQATNDDLNHIAELHRQCFTRAWSIDEITNLFEKNTTIIIIAKTTSDVCGFNIMRQTQEEAEILSVAVKPKFRNQKIGERLMRTAITKLITDKVPSLFLEVEETNKNAIRLYQNLGFNKVGEREGYYKKNNDNNAIIMHLDLT